MIYTNTEDIYFLNDKNIAVGTERSCQAGFNAVPSQSAFVEKYEELTSSMLCAAGSTQELCAELSSFKKSAGAQLSALSDWISDRVETSCYGISVAISAIQISVADICADISYISGIVDSKFDKAGGDVDGSISVKNVIYAEEIRQFQQDAGYATTYSLLSSGKSGFVLSTDRQSTISLPAAAIDTVTFGGASLCTLVSSAASAEYENAKEYTDKKISQLSSTAVTLDKSESIKAISEDHGVISVEKQDIEIRENQVIDLPTHLDELSNYARDNFLSIGGGTVDGNVRVNGTLNVRDNIFVNDGAISANNFFQFQQDTVSDRNYTLISSYGAGFVLSTDRDINIWRPAQRAGDPAGLKRIYIDGKDLCSYFEDCAASAYNSANGRMESKLSATSADFDTGRQIITRLVQVDGKISAQFDNLVSSDIGLLPGYVTDMVSTAVNDLCGTVDFRMDKAHQEISTYINQKVATAYKPQGSIPTYDELAAMSVDWLSNVTEELTDTVLSSHIGDVYNVIGKGKDTELSGQNYVWVRQLTKSSGSLIWCWDELGGFINFNNHYTKAETEQRLSETSVALEDVMDSKDEAKYQQVTAEVESVSSYIDGRVTDLSGQAWPVLTSYQGKWTDVSNLLVYADILSANDDGAQVRHGQIRQLSDQISALAQAKVHDMSFNAHCHLSSAEITQKSLVQFLSRYSENNLIPNGLVIDVKFKDNAVSAKTTDDVVFGDGDWIYIHAHTTAAKIPIDEITPWSFDNENGQLYVMKAGVSRYEYWNEKSVRLSAYSIVKNCFEQISALNDDSNYETCISSMVKIKDLLSELTDVLK